ncbi:MAG: peptide chain release factor 1 [Verrucomicrobiae bacterium]|nr:peptide chain release factor 1 [Verrucomicrobiae bacterium]
MDFAPYFDRLGARCAELEQVLGEGSIFGDAARAREVGREHSRLKRALGLYAEYRAARDALAKNEGLLQATDAAEVELAEMARAERDELSARIASMEAALRAAILPPEPNEDRDVIVEIRAGTGGNEAALFAADLFRMYGRHVERMPGWKSEVLEMSPADLGGVREVIFRVSGEDAFRRLRFESGVHRVQRVPVTEAQGRIHTSTATVAVLPEAGEVDIALKPEELRIEVCRASGPGGQGVNTTDSAVQVLHVPTGLIVRCQDARSQLKNKERALSILRARLLERRQREEAEAYAAQRRSQVGSGDRNEKIRTYNFPQNRVTDHRVNLTMYDLPSVLDGDIAPFTGALMAAHVEERLAALGG